MSILGKKFFEQPTLKVAKELLGKFLCTPKEKFMITEVEAYDGPKDKASHAYKGKTARNTPMFGPAGVWYVYFVYGMHNMLNIVVGSKNYPAAVLLRGLLSSPRAKLDGPAKLTKFLKIDRKFNGKKAVPKNNLWIEDLGVKIKKSQIKSSPRIGVQYAGEWAKKHYRFYL
ncbi:MAG TPA: DNA-3-methyladenine glycosylase [Candidatus Paceibacterota bacterium]